MGARKTKKETKVIVEKTTTPLKKGKNQKLVTKANDIFWSYWKPAGLFILGVIVGTGIVIMTQYGNIATLKDGSEVVASVKGYKLTADELYTLIKDESGINKTISEVDKFILNEKYGDKKADAENYADEYMTSLKSQYSDDWENFLSYYGFTTDDELKASLVIQYYSDLETKAYVKDAITDAEINKYYANEVAGDIKVSHILIKADYDSNASEEEITAAKAKAKKTAEDLIKKLDASNDPETLFAKLAKKYSDDTSNASKGGDLGWFNKGEMEAAFETAAYGLTKVGEYTTEPVETSYGYHIIIKTAKTKDKESLDDVKSDIINDLVKEKTSADSSLAIKAMIALRTEYKLTFEEPTMKTKYNELMTDNIAKAKTSDEEKANQ